MSSKSLPNTSAVGLFGLWFKIFSVPRKFVANAFQFTAPTRARKPHSIHKMLIEYWDTSHKVSRIVIMLLEVFDLCLEQCLCCISLHGSSSNDWKFLAMLSCWASTWRPTQAFHWKLCASSGQGGFWRMCRSFSDVQTTLTYILSVYRSRQQLFTERKIKEEKGQILWSRQ